ncbi:MAG: hydroxyacylglutathione hydrolase [Myxococcota bacterium]|jgi:hydroxyacylglutathione hydrolase|nr:hydroxyacylglutathione hydrolase [Deltaproteobacteria bacterium]MDP6074124.1 hydroxyacylglutathione hydrolase [Myxococcota bacterium]MDP6241805.1 hydroxyacylglutathione hydrolase [Myxococcota bacterium]MDP7074559.1 hydroxyacylglutathione hydrolase [Myxococcota bacterium]MDP7299469.1 hydroxyacylglutathione hydrolase [Myxococcota bacterium]
MGLRIERIPTLGDNYTYLIVCEDTGEAGVVDAPEEQPVHDRVDAAGAKVVKVLSTHHHPDHSMANPKLAERYSVPVFGHASDGGRLPGLTDGLEEGDTVSVGNQTARILFIPAHTKGDIAYVFDDAKAIFCGDTLFAAGCGRIFEGTPEMMYTALVEKLGTLPDDYRVFCGHEYTESNVAFAAHTEPDNAAVRKMHRRVQEIRKNAAADWHDATPTEMTIPTTIGDERATNPFMRAKDAAALGQIRAEKDSF